MRLKPRKHLAMLFGGEMHRATLACDGVPEIEGPAAALDIAREFAEHRKHYQNVGCFYAGGVLTLIAESDFDPEGLNLRDEFSDCLVAYVAASFDGDIRLISVEEV